MSSKFLEAYISTCSIVHKQQKSGQLVMVGTVSSVLPILQGARDSSTSSNGTNILCTSSSSASRYLRGRVVSVIYRNGAPSGTTHAGLWCSPSARRSARRSARPSRPFWSRRSWRSRLARVVIRT